MDKVLIGGIVAGAVVVLLMMGAWGLGYLTGLGQGEMEERARHYARRWKRLEEREPEGDGADWWKKE